MSKTKNVVIDDRNKRQTSKYLTDLMATIQMAYFKGGRNEEEEEGCVGRLRVHETGEAGVSIDLYHFEGDGQPVCDGLDFDAVCPADLQLIHQRAFCISYDPDWEEHPVVIQCSDTTGSDDSFDLTLDNVPEDVQQRITAWLESQLPTAGQQDKVKYRVMQITDGSADARFIKFSDIDDLRKTGYFWRLKLPMYGTVYEGETARTDDWLDTLFARLQGPKPDGYKGHSLSVSDIIAADGRYYYCDAFGWTEVSFDKTDGHIILPDSL